MQSWEQKSLWHTLAQQRNRRAQQRLRQEASQTTERQWLDSLCSLQLPMHSQWLSMLQGGLQKEQTMIGAEYIRYTGSGQLLKIKTTQTVHVEVQTVNI